MSIMGHLCDLHILVIQVQVVHWVLLNHLREQNQQACDHAELIIVKSLLLHWYHLARQNRDQLSKYIRVSLIVLHKGILKQFYDTGSPALMFLARQDKAKGEEFLDISCRVLQVVFENHNCGAYILD